jgi:hypothetical protein
MILSPSRRVQGARKPETPEHLGAEGDDLGDHPLLDPEDVDGLGWVRGQETKALG